MEFKFGKVTGLDGLTTTTWDCLVGKTKVGEIKASQMGIKIKIDQEWICEKDDFGAIIRQCIIAMDEYDSLRPQLTLPGIGARL